MGMHPPTQSSVLRSCHAPRREGAATEYHVGAGVVKSKLVCFRRILVFFFPIAIYFLMSPKPHQFVGFTANTPTIVYCLPCTEPQNSRLSTATSPQQNTPARMWEAVVKWMGLQGGAARRPDDKRIRNCSKRKNKKNHVRTLTPETEHPASLIFLLQKPIT